MGLAIKKISQAEKYLKFGLIGVAGSGKTYSSLLLATKLGDRVLAIDTEMSVAKTGIQIPDNEKIDLIEWGAEANANQIENLTETIITAEKEGYDVVVVDSLSWFWDWLLEWSSAIQKTKGVNSFVAWSYVTPLQKRLIQTILTAKLHILATMRAKVEYAIDTADGKMKINRVGLGAEQGKNIEYEFDLLGLLGENHFVEIKKDRFSKFQDRIQKFDEQFILEIISFFKEGGNKRDNIPSDDNWEDLKKWILSLDLDTIDKEKIAKFEKSGLRNNKEEIEKVRRYFTKKYKEGGKQ